MVPESESKGFFTYASSREFCLTTQLGCVCPDNASFPVFRREHRSGMENPHYERFTHRSKPMPRGNGVSPACRASPTRRSRCISASTRATSRTLICSTSASPRCAPPDKAAGANPGLRRARSPPRVRVQRHAAARVLLRQHDREPARSEPGGCTTRSARATAVSTSGRKTSWPSEACAASVGPSRTATRTNGRITNHWIGDHENGNLAGFVPVVVLDVWEHAFIKDYKPADKGKYIEAFFANLDWKACESRLPAT